MPGPALHHMIADELRKKILDNKVRTRLDIHNNNEKNREIRALLANESNLPYYFLGCQGPDFLFFNFNGLNLGNGTRKFIEKIQEINTFFEDIKKDVIDIIPDPIIEELETVEELVNDMPGVKKARELLDKIRIISDGLSGVAMEKIKSLILDEKVFDFFEHPYRDGVDNNKSNWWWFDVLHYRKTGEFAKKLLDKTKDNLSSPLHLYALGYLTHYAADTVGHPYVNLISGGPYRSHAQRHKTGENFQDVFNFKGDFSYSNLHAFYNFNFTGVVNTDDDNPADHIPNPSSELDLDLATLISDAIKEVYKNDATNELEIGTNIEPLDVQVAYKAYYWWLKLSTTLGNKFPKPKPFHLSEELKEIWDEAMDKLGDVGNDFRNKINTNRDLSIVNLFETLAEIIVASFEAAAAIAEVLLEKIPEVGQVIVSGITLTAALDMIYEHIYDAFQNLRLIVALNGFAFPMDEHKSHPQFKQFIKPSNSDPVGKTGRSVINNLPIKRIDPNLPTPELDAIKLSKHLIYPLGLSSNENLSIPPNPINSYIDKTSMFYAFDDSLSISPNILDSLIAIQEGVDQNGNPVLRTEGAMNILFTQSSLGDALDLTNACYKRVIEGKKIPDFNLDGDRGYGNLCWFQDGARNDTEEINVPNELVKDNIQLKIITN